MEVVKTLPQRRRPSAENDHPTLKTKHLVYKQVEWGPKQNPMTKNAGYARNPKNSPQQRKRTSRYTTSLGYTMREYRDKHNAQNVDKSASK